MFEAFDFFMRRAAAVLTAKRAEEYLRGETRAERVRLKCLSTLDLALERDSTLATVRGSIFSFSSEVERIDFRSDMVAATKVSDWSPLLEESEADEADDSEDVEDKDDTEALR